VSKHISTLSLILSALALILAALAYTQTDDRVNHLLQKRELELVTHWLPEYKQLAADFDIADFPENPQTLEELLDPIVRMIESVSDTSYP